MSRLLTILTTASLVATATTSPLQAPTSLNLNFYENNISNFSSILDQNTLLNSLYNGLQYNLYNSLPSNLFQYNPIKISSLKNFIKNVVLQQVINNNNFNNNNLGVDNINSELTFDINYLSSSEILDIKQRLMSISFYLPVDDTITDDFIQALDFIKELYDDVSPENTISSKTLSSFYSATNSYIADTSDGYLMLTNKTLALSHNYEPENVRLVSVSSNKRITLENKTATATEAMFQKAKEDGIDLMLISGYRNFEYQNILFNNKVNDVGFAEANTVIALPGESEHQTGYVIDISCSSIGYELLTNFEDTKEFKWLSENASDFGFILRYPSSKENITNYTYEPWHYRYIGDPEIAKFITQNNLTLEEYHKNYYKLN